MSNRTIELTPVGFSHNNNNTLSSDVEEPVHGFYRQNKTSVISAESTYGEGPRNFQPRPTSFHNSVGPQTPTYAASGSPGLKRMKIPKLLREFLAETLGTFLLVLFGDGAIAQVVLGGKSGSAIFGDFQSIAFGYGFALIIGILASGGVSGGHLNPAVTLAMAVIKKCKWIQVPVYMAGQYFGAFLASAVLYGVYAEAIQVAEKNSGNLTSATYGIFASYPNGEINPGGVTLAFDQILGTALLLVIICSVTDSRNMNVISGLVPLLIGFGLLAIHLSFGLNAGCAINPARDFSPRLFTLMAGWGNAPFTAGDSFFWIPWLLPHIGGVLGAILYQFMIELHHPEDDD